MQKVDRSIVRNEAYQKKSVSIRERHNERKNQGYSNPDIVTDRSYLNVHFKTCEVSYAQAFDKMLEAGTISTRGLQPDAKVIDELVFDVNTAYFDRNGGYEYAKDFFEEAYRLAIQEAGGEQYILSAVMHADERNRALSEQLGRDVFHYHLHVIYVPVVDKEIKWSKRCKDPALVGTTKEVIKQVSHSKKWPKLKQLDRDGNPVLSKNGKAILINSYSLLQDRFFEHMRAAGYTDFERGERGSTAEHLSVLDYKIQQDTQHISSLNEVIEDKENTAVLLDKKVEKQTERLSGLQEKISVTKQAVATFSEIEDMTKKTISGNVQLSPADWKTVSGLAKKGVTAEGDISDLKKQLAAAKKDAQIYKSRWDRLLEETKLFREAVKHAPRLVKEFLASVFRRPPEKQEPERTPKRKNKDVEL
ncbi:plasmid recombination protein [Faecalispora sporosphaeroides]|uniref:plasmid recombination protein n=1 Tax=Faecalispora sporosphaeroides TaxID=1549 RepID=UPI00037CFEDF|nr:plasmid recombination protein [Faecalispora sporosphaeroides]